MTALSPRQFFVAVILLSTVAGIALTVLFMRGAGEPGIPAVAQKGAPPLAKLARADDPQQRESSAPGQSAMVLESSGTSSPSKSETSKNSSPAVKKGATSADVSASGGAAKSTGGEPSKLPVPPRKPLPASLALPQMAKLYSEAGSRAETATERLKQIEREDPVGYKALREQIRETAKPLQAVALAQALEDPSMRPMIMDQMRDAEFFNNVRDAFARGSEGGHLNFPKASTPDELADLIKEAGPAYENKFQMMKQSFGLSDEIAQLLVDSAGAGWIKWNMAYYMRTHGYGYDAATHSFRVH